MRRRVPAAPRNDPYASRVGGSGQLVDRTDPVVYGDARAPGEHALSDEQVRFYEDNGYLKLEDHMPDVVDALLKETDELAEKLKGRPELITEPDSQAVRTIFSPHEFGEVARQVAADPRIVDPVTQLLGSEVYIHHSRTNVKPAMTGRSFAWHSDFETWHVEDGLPKPRVLTAWIFLARNTVFNGPLFVIAGSHKWFYSCPGWTPSNHHLTSLKKQEYGTPDAETLQKMIRDESDLVPITGEAGTVVLHEGNVMHASTDNISPWPRTNIFYVFNSVENKPVEPYGGTRPRPRFLRNTDYTPVRRGRRFGTG